MDKCYVYVEEHLNIPKILISNRKKQHQQTNKQRKNRNDKETTKKK